MKPLKITSSVLKSLRKLPIPLTALTRALRFRRAAKVRIMVKSDTVSDTDIVVIAKDIVKRIESELEYPGQIKVNVIRETRATEYAK